MHPLWETQPSFTHLQELPTDSSVFKQESQVDSALEQKSLWTWQAHSRSWVQRMTLKQILRNLFKRYFHSMCYHMRSLDSISYYLVQKATRPSLRLVHVEACIAPHFSTAVYPRPHGRHGRFFWECPFAVLSKQFFLLQILCLHFCHKKPQ